MIAALLLGIAALVLALSLTAPWAVVALVPAALSVWCLSGEPERLLREWQHRRDGHR